MLKLRKLEKKISFTFNIFSSTDSEQRYETNDLRCVLQPFIPIQVVYYNLILN